MEDCRFSIPDIEDSVPAVNELDVPLNAILPRPHTSFLYRYDLGDNWYHKITLEETLLPEPKIQYPLCLAGARHAPPEDVGGPSGYDNYLKVLSNRYDVNHQEFLDWRGRFNPEAFSLRSINAALKREFRGTAAQPPHNTHTDRTGRRRARADMTSRRLNSV